MKGPSEEGQGAAVDSFSLPARYAGAALAAVAAIVASVGVLLDEAVLAIVVAQALALAGLGVAASRTYTSELDPDHPRPEFPRARMALWLTAAVFAVGNLGWFALSLRPAVSFAADATGVLVLQIEGDEQGQPLQRDLVASLNAELRLVDAEFRAWPERVDETQGLAAAHAAARRIGQSAGATLVIWGSRIGEAKFHPRLTVVEDETELLFAGDRALPVQSLLEVELPPAVVGEPLGMVLAIAGLEEHRAGHFDAAVDTLTQAIELLGDSTARAGVVCMRGHSQLMDGQLWAAVADFELAVADEVDGLVAFQAWNSRGGALMMLGLVGPAQQSYERAAELAPSAVVRAVTLSSAGLCAQVEGRDSAAASLYEAALALDPANPFGLDGRARLRRERREFDAALRDHDAALRAPLTDLGRAQFLANKGVTLDGAGRYVEAIACFNEVLQLPLDPVGHAELLSRTHTNRGVALYNLGAFAESIRAHEIAVGLRPGHPATLNRLAVSMAAAGDYRGALEHLQTAELGDAGPILSAKIYTNQAVSLLELGDTSAAFERAKDALRTAPSLAMAHNAMGLVLEELGDFDGAQAHFLQAAELDPSESVYRSKADQLGAAREAR